MSEIIKRMHKVSTLLKASTSGAFDLPSIMVGIVVLGVVAGITTAAVFGAIPWAQNNTAQNTLQVISAAESGHYSETNTYAPMAALVEKKYLNTTPTKTAVVNASATNTTCYVAMIKSDANRYYYITDTLQTPVEYSYGSGGREATCGNLALDDIIRTNGLV